MKKNLPPLHAVFPVRAGSKRVHNKNIRSFCGSSLLQIKIHQLLNTPEIQGVYVSSESAEMLAIAEASGAYPLVRDNTYATDDVPMSEVYAYIGKQLPEGDVLFTHATNPLCTEKTYSRCITNYRQMDERFDSLTTVLDVKDFLYLDGKAINFDPLRKPRSQDLPEIIKLTHAVSILPRDTMISRKNLLGAHPMFLKLSESESIDIDTEQDFMIAEFLFCLQKQGKFI